MSYRTSIFECIDSKVKKRCYGILKYSLTALMLLRLNYVLLHLEESLSLKER